MTGIHPRLMNLWLNEAKIPGNVRGHRLKDLHTEDRTQQRSIRAAREFVANLRDHYVHERRTLETYPEDRSTVGKGLLLLGPPGTGKTTVAALVAQEAFLLYRMPVLFLAFADVISAKVEQIRLDGQVRKGNETATARYWELDDFLSKVAKVPLLVLDDMGKERRTGSGFAEDETDMIIRARYRSMRPTVVTSNIPTADWGTIYNASMGSFIHEAFDILSMPGTDRRAGG